MEGEPDPGVLRYRTKCPEIPCIKLLTEYRLAGRDADNDSLSVQ